MKTFLKISLVSKEMNELIENKYKKGEVVFERTHPTQKLVVRRFADRVYYCLAQENPAQKELVYFERELMADPTATKKS
jgi:hypothetical protein